MTRSESTNAHLGINFFQPEERLRAWRAPNPEIAGAGTTAAEASTLGERIFGGRLTGERR